MHLFNIMKEWIISIASVVIFTSIISLIIPEGKMGEFIKGIFSLLIILIIIKPIFSLTTTNLDFSNIFNGAEIVLQNDYLDYISNKKTQKLTKECKEIIEKIGVKNADININYYVAENGNTTIKIVEINLKNAVLILNKEHIDIIDEIKNLISSYLLISSDMVIIYE